MGRRKFITQKEAQAFAKKPHLAMISFGLFAIAMSIFLLFFELERTGLTIVLLVLGLLSLFIGIFICIVNYVDKGEEQTSIKNCSEDLKTQSETRGSKPEFDFFTQDAIINEQYLQALIDAHKKVRDAKIPIYDGLEVEKIYNVEFNSTTRIAKVTFELKKYYRTIERYVQQNYQRSPIYSELKSKTRQYTKTYKLTNNVLENLHGEFNSKNEHLYMRLICALNSPSLVPYMFFLKALGEQLKIAVEYDKAQMSEKQNSIANIEKQIIGRKETLSFDISKASKPLEKAIKKTEKITKKLNSLEQKGKVNPKVEANLKNLNNYIREQEKSIQDMKREISSLDATLSAKKATVSKECEELKQHIVFIQHKEYSLLKKFKPLQAEISDATEFIPLDSISGIEYRKIVGCYVIRNIENKKCYVGQSKDVLRRLKQHFKGTVPNNPIFAEDYYTSSTEDKSKLFEVKIIELQTKDELDRTEKDLIEQYDCFYSGYNGTHGNT